MNDCKANIKFYSLGSCKLNLSKIEEEKLNLCKKLVTSPELNNAMKKVVIKDIEFLKVKLDKMLKSIKKFLVTKNVEIILKEQYNIEEINMLIDDIKNSITKLTKDKNNSKVGLFSSNKKSKRKNLQNIDDSIVYLSKCQIDIIAIQNEYNKLDERMKNLGPVSEINNDNVYEEDPLERTINFYMKQKEEY